MFSDLQQARTEQQIINNKYNITSYNNILCGKSHK